MDFSFSDTQKEIAEITRKFALKEIAPIVDQDEAASYFRRDLFPKLGSAGLIGATASSKFGGSELGVMEYSIILEELAYFSSGYATSFSVTGLPIKILEYFGSSDQQEKYLPGLIGGEQIGAFCLTEPGAGSDAKSLKTTAEKQGNAYLINGTKQFITNGGEADVYVVMARTSEGKISCFVIDKEAEGVKSGKLEKKMGMRVSPTREMIFDHVEVPAEHLIGGEGNGFKIAMTALDSGRISIASIANGISRAALDRSVVHANEREQFGKAIIEFQGIGFLIANMATELEASRWLTRYAAYLKDSKQEFTQIASMAKLKSTESCMRITTDAVQVLGGYGYTEEYVVERLMREAKMLELVEGTSQIQRIVIARNFNKGH